MRPIYDDETGGIAAVAAVDISITGIRTAFIRLLVNLGIIITVIMLAAVAVYYAVVRRQMSRCSERTESWMC